VKRIRRLLYHPDSPRAALTPVVAAGILTITAALALVAWQAGSSRALPAPYYKWIDEDVAYIVNDQERASFNNLRTVPEAEKFIEQFWLRRAPTAGAVGKVRLEHYRRIAYSNERFATGNTPGWKTDRGRIYITFGPPDEIEDHPAGGRYTTPAGEEAITYAFQQWRYRHIAGVGDNIIMEFVDKTASKDYRMTKDPHAKEVAP
jgi:GWxTD domain-containing protein